MYFYTHIAYIYYPHTHSHIYHIYLRRTGTDYKLWHDAAAFINNEDSRVRTDIRLIDGIECGVWSWVTPVAAAGGKRLWQGTGK